MTVLRVSAHAKINLSLAILGKRPDGYHDLHSFVTHALDLADDLTIRIDDARSGFALDVTGPFADTVPKTNSSLEKAYDRFVAATDFDRHVHVSLQKKIPATAGLGGGSSDAAALLRALHFAHTGGGEPDTALFDLAATIGADVPACLLAAPCAMEGLGEKLTPQPLPEANAIIVWPGAGPSTKALYEAVKPGGHPAPQPKGDDTQWLVGLKNDFEPVAVGLTPAIADALNGLRALPGCIAARLTGSGTAVFGLFEGPAPDLKEIAGFQAFTTRFSHPKKPLVTIER